MEIKKRELTKTRSRKKIVVLSSLIGVLFLGCIGDPKTNPIQIPSPYTYGKMTKINRYKDKYQIILGNFGASLSKYIKLKYSSYHNINIEVNEIKNNSSDGKLPVSSQGMLINSVAMLTATSGNFFIPKKIMIDENAFTGNDDMEKYLNGVARVLQLEGSIDRADIIYSKSNSLNADGTMTYKGHRVDLGFENEDTDNIREISLTLRFIDKRKGEHFNSYSRYGTASNSIRVAKKTDGSGFGVFLLGSGITHNSSKTYTPGIHQAIKILVEHTIIQAFGRNFEVPYWNSSRMYSVDELQENNMRLDWNNKNHDEKLREVQIVLNMYGFSIPLDVKDSKKKKLSLKKTELALQAISKYIGINGNIENFNYYFNLYNNMPFAGFFPRNYNNLRAEIVNINSGKLPNYVEHTPRPLPKAPSHRDRSNSTVIFHTGTNMDIISGGRRGVEEDYTTHSNKPHAPKRQYYDEKKKSIDEEEANLFN